jgi:hypothetical protein
MPKCLLAIDHCPLRPAPHNGVVICMVISKFIHRIINVPFKTAPYAWLQVGMI